MLRNLFLAFAFLSVISAVGCAGKKIVSHPGTRGDYVFPPGTYEHDIDLTVNEVKSYHFKGVVRIKPEEITVIALSVFGTTEFRIVENRATKEIKTEIYRDAFKKFEPRIREYYSVLREALLLDSKPNDSGERVVTTKVGGQEVVIELSQFDKNQIPEKMTITTPQFRAVIKVTSYEI